MSTTTTTIPSWQARILSHALQAKTANTTGDFTYFSILRANNDSAPTVSPSVDPTVLKDLNNINNANVGVVQNNFTSFSSNTQQLKTDGNPDKPAWITRITNNGDDLKKQNDASIDDATNAGIAHIQALPDQDRDGAADIFVTGRNIVMGVVQTVKAQLEKVMNSITDFFTGIWNKMMDAVNAVKNAAEGAWHAITGWFSAVLPPAPALKSGQTFFVKIDGTLSADDVEVLMLEAAKKGYLPTLDSDVSGAEPMVFRAIGAGAGDKQAFTEAIGGVKLGGGGKVDVV